MQTNAPSEIYLSEWQKNYFKADAYCAQILCIQYAWTNLRDLPVLIKIGSLPKRTE
uniref:Uncharacterized protein n=1 Tax=Salvator merianae TaxID=96440 RepID=A0A8D0C121_SALMN